jgi:transposase
LRAGAAGIVGGDGSEDEADGRHTEAHLDAVRQGAPRESAAEAARVAKSTLQRWLAQGRAADASAKLRGFAEALAQADAEYELRAVARIERAAAEDWRAQAWRLARKWPQRYGQRALLEVASSESAELRLAGLAGLGDISKLSNDDLATLDRLLAKLDGDGRRD